MAAVSNSTTKEVRDQLTDRCSSILASYRRHCATPTSPAQLILPESLKLLPIFCLALTKTPALRGGLDVHIDLRVHSMRLLKHLPVVDIVGLLYPRIAALHTLPEYVSQFQGEVLRAWNRREFLMKRLVDTNCHHWSGPLMPGLTQQESI